MGCEVPGSRGWQGAGSREGRQQSQQHPFETAGDGPNMACKIPARQFIYEKSYYALVLSVVPDIKCMLCPIAAASHSIRACTSPWTSDNM